MFIICSILFFLGKITALKYVLYTCGVIEILEAVSRK